MGGVEGRQSQAKTNPSILRHNCLLAPPQVFQLSLMQTLLDQGGREAPQVRELLLQAADGHLLPATLLQKPANDLPILLCARLTRRPRALGPVISPTRVFLKLPHALQNRCFRKIGLTIRLENSTRDLSAPQAMFHVGLNLANLKRRQLIARHLPTQLPRSKPCAHNEGLRENMSLSYNDGSMVGATPSRLHTAMYENKPNSSTTV